MKLSLSTTEKVLVSIMALFGGLAAIGTLFLVGFIVAHTV